MSHPMPLELFQLLLPILPASSARSLSQCSKQYRRLTYAALQTDRHTARQLLLEAMEAASHDMVMFKQFGVRECSVQRQEALRDLRWLLQAAVAVWGEQAAERMNLQVTMVN